MVIKTDIRTYRCTVCGSPTEWDEELGDEPQCPDCWDARAGIDNEVAAKQRAYYQEHKDEAVAYQRAYREEHKDEVVAKHYLTKGG